MDNSVATLEVGMIVNVYPACQTGTVLDIIMHPVTNVLTCAVRLNDGGLASFDTHDLTPVLTPSPLDSLPEPYWVGAYGCSRDMRRSGHDTRPSYEVLPQTRTKSPEYGRIRSR